MADKLRAGMELKKQNYKEAEAALLAARDGFRQCNLHHYEFTTEAKLCEITGETKTKRFEDVQDWFRSQDIKNQSAFVKMHYPD